MLAVGIVIVVVSVLVYAIGGAYVAGRFRLSGADPRAPESIPDESIPDIPRAIPALVMLSYPGVLIGLALIVVALV